MSSGDCLGIFDEHIEVAIVVEDAGVEQFIFELVSGRVAGSSSTRSSYGKARLRILVEILHVGVGRRAVEVEVVFLHVLAVIAFAVGQPEQPFLENRIFAVPQRERKTEPLLVV